jgi:hypothetical protein
LVIVVAMLAATIAPHAASGDTPRRGGVFVTSPTYLPGHLPAGFGQHPVELDTRSDGYVLIARAGPTTYTIEVLAPHRGRTQVFGDWLAPLTARTTVTEEGRIEWIDRMAIVRISATGAPPGPRLAAIGKHMVVGPRRALHALAGQPGTHRRVAVPFAPVRFRTAEVSVPQSLYGRIGRFSVRLIAPRLRVGVGTCFACTGPREVASWRAGGTRYRLVAMPIDAPVPEGFGTFVDRTFDPVLGSDLVLLTPD